MHLPLLDDVSTSGGKKDARSISETPGVQNKDIKDVATFSDTWTAYDLETSDNTTTDIEARKQDEVRTAKSTYLSDLTNILVSSSVVLAFTLRIPALMKTKSDNEDCATSTGSFGRIGYKYYAIGSDCATTSQVIGTMSCP